MQDNHTWGIRGVPEPMRKRFVGLAKTRGKAVGELMQELMERAFAEEAESMLASSHFGDDTHERIRKLQEEFDQFRRESIQYKELDRENVAELKKSVMAEMKKYTDNEIAAATEFFRDVQNFGYENNDRNKLAASMAG